MTKRLKTKIKMYIIQQCQKGVAQSQIAKETGITRRHVNRLYSRFRSTGTVQSKLGRPRKHATTSQMHLVQDIQNIRPDGVLRTARHLRKSHDISYQTVYRIMKKSGRVESSPAKSKKRKYVRFERKYSNAMWHVDWHIMKDPRLKGMNLIVYLDDASRCVTGAYLFEEATSFNAVIALRLAVRQFGRPASILSDNGSCFVGAKQRMPKSTWRPTLFEGELLDQGISLINSRPYHLQTNGKLERFYRTVEDEIYHYEDMGKYIDYYNEDRLHWSLDIDNYETPLRAFHNRKATDAIRKKNPRWMEMDADD